MDLTIASDVVVETVYEENKLAGIHASSFLEESSVVARRMTVIERGIDAASFLEESSTPVARIPVVEQRRNRINLRNTIPKITIRPRQAVRKFITTGNPKNGAPKQTRRQSRSTRTTPATAAVSTYRTIVPCVICGKPFPNASEMKKHKASQHRNTATRRSSDAAGILEDLRTINSMSGVASVSRPFSLSRTNGAGRRSYKRLPNSYVCRIEPCVEVFETESGRRCHEISVHYVREKSAFGSECRFCLRRFPSGVMLKNHIAVFHENLNFACNFCGKIFGYRRALISHLDKEHESDLTQSKSKFTCRLCSRKYASETTLKRHVNIAHLKPKTGKSMEFLCRHCDRRFRLRTTRNKHESMSHAPKTKLSVQKDKAKNKKPKRRSTKRKSAPAKQSEDFPCNFCATVFQTKAARERHTRHIHKQKPASRFPCRFQCGKEFVLFKVRRKHELVQHQEEIRRNKISRKSGIYPCPDCNRKFRKKKALETHQIWHQDICNVCPCGGSFKLESSLNNHIRLVHGDSDKAPHVCSECGIGFLKLTWLRSHFWNSHNDSTKKLHYKCDMCVEAFSGVKALREHKENIHQVPLTFPCGKCGEQLPSIKSRLKHRVEVHGAKLKPAKKATKKFACDKCECKFYERKQLKRHLQLHAENKARGPRRRFLDGIPGYRCGKCDAAFATTKESCRHRKTAHRNRKCSFDGCDRCFNTVYSLERHEMIHKKIFDFKCLRCGALFTSGANMRKHEKEIHGKIDSNEKEEVEWTDQCEFCHRRYPNKKHLKRHFEFCPKFDKKTRPAVFETPENKFKCDRCYRAFEAEYRLVQHIKLYHNREGIKCPSCDKTFPRPYMLERHENTVHKNIRPYPCDFCDKFWPSAVAVQDHKREIHRKEYLEERGKLMASRKEKKWTCETCNKPYRKHAEFLDHMDRVHGDGKKKSYECKFCGKSMVSALAVRRHARYAHNVTGQVCHVEESNGNQQGSNSIQDNTSQSSSDYIVSDEEPTQSASGNRSSTAQSESVHSEGITNKKFECNLCGKSVGSDLALRRHTRNAHGDSKRTKRFEKAKPVKAKQTKQNSHETHRRTTRSMTSVRESVTVTSVDQSTTSVDKTPGEQSETDEWMQQMEEAIQASFTDYGPGSVSSNRGPQWGI